MPAKYQKIIQAFSNANGAPGFEDEVLDVARAFASDAIAIDEDKLRNLYLPLPGNTGQRPVVMIDGHTDEVGFMIQLVNGNGTLKFVPLGGWSPQVVMGQKVRVRNAQGKYIPGVVGAKPPHFSGGNNKLVDIQDMFIDVGATSKDELINEFKIEPGAPVTPDAAFSFQKKTGLMTGKAFDNRLGCAAVIETLNALENEALNVDVVGTLSAQEEVGLRGAQVAARRVRPDLALIFEGTPADDTFVDSNSAQSVLKKGPQVRHRDNSMVPNPRFIKYARDIAKEAGVPFQDAVRDSGGTNGGAVHLAHEGVPVVVIGAPVRYIHAPHGIAAIQDFAAAVDWACAILKKLDHDVIKGF